MGKIDAEQQEIVLDKSAILQEGKLFHETPLKSIKCSQVLTKMLQLLHQGDQPLTENESQLLFFQITRLFQSKDTHLRQLTYLILRELAMVCSADTIIMVTSSLGKDLQQSAAELKPSALRCLLRIVCAGDVVSQMGGLERYLKQALTDRDPAMVSSALTCSIHLLHSYLFSQTVTSTNTTQQQSIVKRWMSEVQEATTKPMGLIQYHALGLLFQLRQNDKVAVLKMVQQNTKGNLMRSPQAWVIMLRMIGKVIDDEGGMNDATKPLFDQMESCLRHRHEMVNLEAARQIANIKNVSQRELFSAVTVLQLFLNSPKGTLRFAAIRTLNRIATQFPGAVTGCNLDMESLISDQNRSIATLAITTLLKTGNEASVERLLTQLQTFISEISDEFKVLVIEAIRQLAQKFPSKHLLMLNFLSTSLRDEGGYEFKRVVVEGLFDIVNDNPEAKDQALSQLCEFIEDCEFTRLAVRILFTLGEEGPKMPNPAKYVRHIYNRTILENSPVRAAAVSALSKFAVGELKPKIMTLLRRCLEDADDEVRDRAVFYLEALEDQELHFLLEDSSTFSMDVLEQQLCAYVNNVDAHVKPFDISQVPVVARHAEAKKVKAALQPTAVVDAYIPPAASQKAAQNQPTAALKDTKIEKMSEFAQFGPLFRSGAQISLTETDVAEYVVSAVVHVFAQHLVVEFKCNNTLDDVLLENVKVVVEAEEATDLVLFGSIAIPALKYGEPASAYVVFKKGSEFATGTFTTQLKFVTKDCDPATGVPDEEGYDDSYQMDPLEINVYEYIVPQFVPKFTAAWDSLKNEIVETLQLPSEISSVKQAIDSLCSVIGKVGTVWCAVEGSDNVKPNVNNHNLLLSGLICGGVKAMCRIRMAVVAGGVTVEVAVRSEREDVSQMLSESIG